MLDSFLYSLNIIAPIFILVMLGVFFKKIKLVNDSFLAVSDKLVFNVCLPCLLFVDIVTSDSKDSFDISLILFCCAAVTVVVILACLISCLLIKTNDKRGAFVQGVYRSNSAILGITLATSMFGSAGSATIAGVLPFIVMFFNVYAVIILSIFAPVNRKMTKKQILSKILKTVIKNPLIISIALALIWKLIGFSGMPKILDVSLSYLSDMATPLALISLGASIKADAIKGRLGLAVASSLCRLVFVPALVVMAALLFGFRGPSLGVVFIIFGGPAAVSSYIMAKQMGSDSDLAAQILLISTVLSTVTMFAGIFILKVLELI